MSAAAAVGKQSSCGVITLHLGEILMRALRREQLVFLFDVFSFFFF